MRRRFYIAIPAMDELTLLPATLMDLDHQTGNFDFEVYICVNQPDTWWNDEDKKPICIRNRQLLDFLQNYHRKNIHVIDKSSQGLGWQGKKSGVGWARKILFDKILTIANADDVIVSLDADTHIESGYLQSIAEQFEKVEIQTISVPYYHRLTDDESANRAILRYEIYMRNYLLNMYRIKSPYNFTAIGSAIAVKVSALRKIGGITPAKSGEDFYLLQKLRKMAQVSNANRLCVYPAARFSSRVFFGTGPAMIKGSTGNWDSYPIYHFRLFDIIKETYDVIDKLYTEDIDTEFVQFLQSQYGTDCLWQPLRENVKDYAHFVRAFHEKADGLRILQFLKYKNTQVSYSDDFALYENLKLFFGEQLSYFMSEEIQMSRLSIEELDEIRNRLYEKEMLMRNIN